MPCITPTGKKFIVKGKRFTLPEEALVFQGYDPSDWDFGANTQTEHAPRRSLQCCPFQHVMVALHASCLIHREFVPCPHSILCSRLSLP